MKTVRACITGAWLALGLGVGLEATGAGAEWTSGNLVLAVGAAGEEKYETNFASQVELWTRAAKAADLRVRTVGGSSPDGREDLDALGEVLKVERTNDTGVLWLVFIGHGTFDGQEARFNLRGPDLTATQLREWLASMRRPAVIINTASSSAPFLAKLSGTNRVVITATRSGHEQNFARFGSYFARAIGSLEADLDKDAQVSAFEAFLVASRETLESYKEDGFLATEHALLDDNGDKLGTPADWFRGLRATRKPESGAPVDGLLARQLCVVPSEAEKTLPAEVRERRDALERAVLALRDKKAEMKEEDYFEKLDALLLEMAMVYEPL